MCHIEDDSTVVEGVICVVDVKQSNQHVVSNNRTRLQTGIDPNCHHFVSSAGSPASLPYWLSVSSWCASGTEEKPLIGSPTSTCCPPPTPAPPTSPTTSWPFCLQVWKKGLQSRGRRCEKSTPHIKTSSGVCSTEVTEPRCFNMCDGCVQMRRLQIVCKYLQNATSCSTLDLSFFLSFFIWVCRCNSTDDSNKEVTPSVLLWTM